MQTILQYTKVVSSGQPGMALSIAHQVDSSTPKSIKNADEQKGPSNNLERLKASLCELNYSWYIPNGEIATNDQTKPSLSHY